MFLLSGDAVRAGQSIWAGKQAKMEPNLSHCFQSEIAYISGPLASFTLERHQKCHQRQALKGRLVIAKIYFIPRLASHNKRFQWHQGRPILPQLLYSSPQFSRPIPIQLFVLHSLAKFNKWLRVWSRYSLANRQNFGGRWVCYMCMGLYNSTSLNLATLALLPRVLVSGALKSLLPESINSKSHIDLTARKMLDFDMAFFCHLFFLSVFYFLFMRYIVQQFFLLIPRLPRSVEQIWEEIVKSSESPEQLLQFKEKAQERALHGNYTKRRVRKLRRHLLRKLYKGLKEDDAPSFEEYQWSSVGTNDHKMSRDQVRPCKYGPLF